MSEQDRLDKAQAALNVAWGGFGVGWISAGIGMVTIAPLRYVAPWLVVCACVGLMGLIAALAIIFGEGDPSGRKK